MPFAAFFVAFLLLLCIPDGSRKLALCLLLGALAGLCAVHTTSARLERARANYAGRTVLLTAEVEQALLRAATGYTVTDRTIKYVNGVKTVETKERHIPPSQPAIEFYLINKKGEDYSRNGGGSGNADGALADILEALKNG